MSGASSAGYRVLARKYRPTTFADLVGQEAMVRTLANAFASGRIAQAYMLTGVRGVGKTTTARLIARALNYGDAPSIDMPEMTAHCAAILESRHMDVIEMDAASNTGVDNMREIIESVRYAPISARYKVYIIDEVHMLSKSAFNALLKTLEEPPAHVKFIFATTEIRKVPVTILSRCQRFDLKRFTTALLLDHLKTIAARENVEAEDEALRSIARAAEGSARDGLSLLDQAIAYGDAKITATGVQAMLGLMDRSRTIELFDAVMSGDASRAIGEIESQHEAGGDPRTILTDLADFVHWVTRLKVVPDAVKDASRTEIEKTRGKDYAQRIGMAQLSRAWQMLLKGIKETELQGDALMAAEMVLIRLAYAADLPSGEDLVALARSGERAAPAVRPSPAPQAASVERGPLQRSPLALKTETAPPPSEGKPETRPLASFRDIVALAGERRDIKLKQQLETLVRPIRVAPGQIEVAFEPNAPQGLANELQRKLEAWTGARWMVVVARDGGEKPLAHQARDRREGLFMEAREHPDVRAILSRFPGAEITDVRDPTPIATSPNEEKEDESP
jgi:DNA polymerase-3 subunit gamma/tau